MLPTSDGPSMEDGEPTAEELALKLQVTKALESQGVLGKIRAQLRAAVFQAVHGTAAKATDGLTPRSSSSTLASANAVALFGDDGRLVLALVADLLDALALEHSLAVFLAETNAEHHGVKWRPSNALCERVGVSPKDERTPVLVELVRSQAAGDATVKVDTTRSLGQSSALRTESRPVEHAAAKETTLKEDVSAKASTVDDGGRRLEERLRFDYTANEPEEDELDSLAEEVASGSFEEESVVEESSTSHNHIEQHAEHRGTTKERAHVSENDDDDEDDREAAIRPPPVPSTLRDVPPTETRSLEGLKDRHVDDEEEEEEEEEEEQEDQDAFDVEAEAERLRQLDAKLKAMESEDEAGVLQQLKASLAMELQPDDDEEEEHHEDEDNGRVDAARGGAAAKENEEQDDAGEDDAYGSDFEEEVEEEEEGQSDLSEDVESMSALSESEEIAAVRPRDVDAQLAKDEAVESEDALNSYDYIEPVERL